LCVWQRFVSAAADGVVRNPHTLAATAFGVVEMMWMCQARNLNSRKSNFNISFVVRSPHDSPETYAKTEPNEKYPSSPGSWANENAMKTCETGIPVFEEHQAS
jgi:hypothetical protein